MKRYDLVTNYRCGASIEEMEPADDGEWVRFEDIPASPLSEIERRLLEALKDIAHDMRNFSQDEMTGVSPYRVGEWAERIKAIACDLAEAPQAPQETT